MDAYSCRRTCGVSALSHFTIQSMFLAGRLHSPLIHRVELVKPSLKTIRWVMPLLAVAHRKAVFN